MNRAEKEFFGPKDAEDVDDEPTAVKRMKKSATSKSGEFCMELDKIIERAEKMQAEER